MYIQHNIVCIVIRSTGKIKYIVKTCICYFSFCLLFICHSFFQSGFSKVLLDNTKAMSFDLYAVRSFIFHSLISGTLLGARNSIYGSKVLNTNYKTCPYE